METVMEAKEKPKTDFSVYQSLNTARHIISCARIMRASKNFSEGMQQALLVIKDLIPCERIYILETDCRPVKVLSEWTAPGLPTAKWIFAQLKDNNINAVDKVMKAEEVSVVNADDFRESNPEAYKDMMRMRLRNTLAAPFFTNGVMFGNLCLDNFDYNTVLNAREFLQAVSFFIASEIQTNRLIEKLRYLSGTDPLTGIHNRTAMNRRLDELKTSPGALGMLIADINGLKTVNDSRGHAAGDRLIQRAADILSRSFDSVNIYRAGGDEFVVLMAGVSEETFMDHVRQLNRLLASDRDCSMAHGCRYSAICSDPEELMHETDRAMYIDKQTYYKINT